jgi:N-acetylmuramoyl-L-alanine amidase
MPPTLESGAAAWDDSNRVGRRNVVAGLAGIGLAGVGISRVFAQDATSTPTDDTSADATPAVGSSGETTDPATHYETFIHNLASALGSDAATVDTAIRDSLKAMVDDKLAAGDITEDKATEARTWIDESPAPIRIFVSPGHGKGDKGAEGHPGGPANSGDQGGGKTDVTTTEEASPTI